MRVEFHRRAQNHRTHIRRHDAFERRLGDERALQQSPHRLQLLGDLCVLSQRHQHARQLAAHRRRRPRTLLVTLSPLSHRKRRQQPLEGPQRPQRRAIARQRHQQVRRVALRGALQHLRRRRKRRRHRRVGQRH